MIVVLDQYYIISFISNIFFIYIIEIRCFILQDHLSKILYCGDDQDASSHKLFSYARYLNSLVSHNWWKYNSKVANETGGLCAWKSCQRVLGVIGAPERGKNKKKKQLITFKKIKGAFQLHPDHHSQGDRRSLICIAAFRWINKLSQFFFRFCSN